MQTLREGTDASQAVRDVDTIWQTDRWFTFPKFEETAKNVAAIMRRAGLEDVEIGNPPADGVSQGGFWTMPMAWDVKTGTLEILDTDGARRDADAGRLPESSHVHRYVERSDAGRRSGYRSGSGAGQAGGRGPERQAGAGPARREGGAGEGGGARGDQRDHGKSRSGGRTRLGQFVRRQRLELYQGQRAAGVLFDHAARIAALAGTLEEGAGESARECRQPLLLRRLSVCHGRDPRDGRSNGEEVLSLGHLFEQGAHDNATGVASIIGAAETLNRLIQAGKLPRPKRTIRVLGMGECYGTMYYLQQNQDRVKRTVAAMCIDSPAGLQNLAGTEYTWILNPHSAKSYVDALALRLAEEYYPSVGRPWGSMEHRSSTDNYLGDPSIGIPTVMPHGGYGVLAHHNSHDTPATVDPNRCAT